jgi:hypothetical protein
MGNPLARRFGTLGLAGILAVALVVTTTTDLFARDRARQAQGALAATRTALSAERFDLEATTYDRTRATDDLSALQSSVGTMLNQMVNTQLSLSSTTKTVSDQGVDITTLQSCLGGVNGALQQIAAHNETQATGDIASVSGACLTLDGGTNGGLVYPFDFPDPFVLRVGSTYFAYATNSTEGNIQIIESTDLTHWSAVGNALPTLPTWAEAGGTWAPSVLQIGGTFLLYYSAAVASHGGEECISVASATQPQGPFVDHSGGPLVCQSSLQGSIDPSPFVDADGTHYLVWKSNGGGAQPSELWAAPLDATGTGFATASPAKLLTADLPWEGGVIEAPDLVLSGGHYFLFYSGNQWDSADYAVGVAICRGPLGPCSDLISQPVLSSGTDLSGPGGETVFTDTAGTPWIAFDAWVPGAVGYPNSRALYLRPLDLAGTIPAVEAAGAPAT